LKDFSKALNYAFLPFRYRLRSQDEIYRRLKKKNTPLAIINKVIKYLKECNYLDDQEFTKNYLETALVKGWGPVRVNFNLKKLGISGKLRKKAVEEIEGKSNELIRLLAEEKLNRLKNNNPNQDKKKIKEKLVRFLANRGFYYRDIYNQLDNFN
jgi:regulatory protein